MWHRVFVFGRLGQDPEMRYTQAGEAVTNLSVAVDRGKDKPCIWIRVSLWKANAENANNYLHKGDSVLVEGVLVADDKGNPKTFERKDGTTGAAFEMVGYNITFAGKAGEHETD